MQGIGVKSMALAKNLHGLSPKQMLCFLVLLNTERNKIGNI